jgi:hypothetical protein
MILSDWIIIAAIVLVLGMIAWKVLTWLIGRD